MGLFKVRVRRTMRLALCGVLVLTIGGCGGDGRPSLVKVEGKVTLNGEPLGGAKLGFIPVDQGDYGRASRATSNADGTFVVGTYAKDDGMPRGKYTVVVEKTEYVDELPDGFNIEDPEANAVSVKMKRFLPEHYGNPSDSGLTVEVSSSGLSPETIALQSEGGPFVDSTGPSANEP